MLFHIYGQFCGVHLSVCRNASDHSSRGNSLISGVDLDGAKPAPVYLWVMDWCRHGTPDKWQWCCIVAMPSPVILIRTQLLYSLPHTIN